MVNAARTVAVFGAYGHTGRFVVAELLDRGYVPLLVGRDEAKLQRLAEKYPALSARTASVDDPASLDRAFADAAAVVNCAGPFASTGIPVIESALRNGIPYVDVAAEIEANMDTFAHFAERARAADVAVVPAMAFYGGLGDLLAAAAIGDEGWTSVDEVHVAYGLSSWHPTAGTQAAGAVSSRRRDGRRVRYADGALSYYEAEGDLELLEWPFPAPTGPRKVLAEFTMADVVTIPSHLSVREVRTYMSVEAADDLSAASATAPAATTAPTASAVPTGPTGPTAVDERGRSAQTFVVDVAVRRGGQERRATASGQDIYAISAPLAVEAVHRILTGQTKTSGVASAAQMFDAPDFLRALSPDLAFTRQPR